MTTDTSFYATLRQEAAAIADDLTAWRRHLHANPERSFQEKATTAFVAETLRSFGIATVRTGFDAIDVGVLAEIGSGKGPCVLLRADMDALPVPDQTGLPWASLNPGVSHACGHDAHTAILLATAKILHAHADELPGTVRFVFQPAEETGMPHQGATRPGAWFVRESGALEGVGAAFALHVVGPMKAGTMFIKEGTAMLAAGFFRARITGKGTHGATPQLGVDPILPTAAMLGEFQSIISREVDPARCAVLSVCSIHAGVTNNVIPEYCEFTGTLRGETTDIVRYMAGRMDAIARKSAEAHRCTADYECTTVYGAVVNEPGVTAVAREAGCAVLGAENVSDMEALSVSEDFTLYGERVPAVMFFWGMADEAKGTGQSLHDPAFRVNEETLPDAAAVMAACAWRWLEQAK